MNSTVTAVESFRFLGTTISQDLKWDNHIDYCEKGPAEAVFPPPAKEVQPASGAADTVPLCHHRVCPMSRVCLVQLPKQTSEDYNGQSGLLRGLSVPLCPASKNFTPPEWGKGLRKSLWTPHTQLTLSLYCCPLAGATDHWAQKQPDTRIVFFPRPYPTWTTHNTPRYCTSVNNSSNLHLYIGHMHSSVYGHFSFCIFLFFITIVILNYCLFSSLLVFFITLIICCLCLHCCLFVLSVLEAPNTKTNSLCVQTHLAIKLFLILIQTHIRPFIIEYST